MANSEINLDKLRALDDNSDKSPDKESLNGVRVLNFLHRNSINSGNFYELFTVQKGLDLTSEGKTKGENTANERIKKAVEILDKYKRPEVMLEKTEAAVNDKLVGLKAAPTNMTEDEFNQVKEGWSHFDLIRGFSLKLMESEAANKKARGEALDGPEKGPEEKITDAIKGKLGFASDKWDTLSTGSKILMGGLALVFGSMLWKADDKGVLGKIRDTIFGGAKVLGIAWLVNKAWYLFTGESALDAAVGAVKGKGKSSTYLKESFKTDDKGAEVMSKAFVQMGDLSFVDLAKRYDDAVKSGKRSIEGTKMPAEEAFKAMELFFGKYKLDKTVAEYGKYNPPVAFNQVVTLEMAKDPEVKLEESFAARMQESVTDKWEKMKKYLGAGAEVAKFKEMVKTEAEVTAAIDGKVLKDKVVAKSFVDTYLAGIVDPKSGIKYRVAGDGYVYLVVNKPMNNVKGEDGALADTLQACHSAAEDFLVEKYKVNKEAALKKSETMGSVFVTDTSSLKYLVRYKVS